MRSLSPFDYYYKKHALIAIMNRKYTSHVEINSSLPFFFWI